MFLLILLPSGWRLEAQTVAAERIIRRPGIVVFREKPFYADDLVKCTRFSRMENRTSLDNPNMGYWVFAVSGGELKLPPQAIEWRFFLDELELPRTLKAPQDLERVTALADELRSASRYNATVAQALAPYLRRVAEAAVRLQKGEWWEDGARWVTKAERERRTALQERSAIDASAETIGRRLQQADELSALRAASESITELEGLPATSAEIMRHRLTLAGRLREVADTKQIELEKSLVERIYAEAKSAFEDAGTLESVMAAAARSEELAKANVTSPDAVAAKDKRVAELSALRGTQERRIRLATVMFDDLNAWKRAIDESRGLEVGTDAEAVLQRSEQLYEKAREIHRQIDAALSDFRGFSGALPAQAIVSGEGLPPPPAAPDQALQDYDNFVRGSGGPGLLAVGELDESAARLKRSLTLYRQLAGVSRRAQRQDLWRARDSFQELLAQMTAVQAALLEEEKKYQDLLDEGRRHEASRNFADAAGAYQSAHAIAPSADLAERIETLKEQDLGL